MTYSETLDYLYARLPMFQRDGAAALKPGLGNITNLCLKLGNPQQQLKMIHLAGTNGKGSTSNFLSSVFQEAGYKTGLFTSPHLIDFRERIRVNGEMISESAVMDFVAQYGADFEEVNASFFEYTTAMAFWYFGQQQADIAIIETGLGGRLDSTNIIEPEVSVITSISMDHVNLLGNTIEEIAAEKAGIIKRSIPVVLAQNDPRVFAVIERFAGQHNSELYSAASIHYPEQWEVGLKGDYQRENVRTVLKTVEVMRQKGWKIEEGHLISGLANVVKNTGFRGRWETLQRLPDVICDVAHNEDGIKWVVKQLKRRQYKSLHIVFGMVKDKTIADILPLLPKDARYYFCNAAIPRALQAEELKEAAKDFGLYGSSYSSVKMALSEAKQLAHSDDLIFVGGSVFVVGEVLE